MRRDEVLERFKTQHAELAKFGVKSLSIFGSVARNKARSDSDIDFLVEFEGTTTFDQYMGLKIFLEDLLKCPVDLVTRKGIRPQLAPAIEREALRVA